MENHINKYLIFEHFANRVTPIQRRTIANWLASPDNKEQYYAWLEEWEALNPQYAVDTETRLHQSLKTLLTESTNDVSSPGIRPLPEFRINWRWAAVVAGLVLLSGLYLSYSYILYRSIETAFGEVRTVTLPEGSRVMLNANSTLRYNRFTFGRQTRQVFLSGEASFDVKHLPNHKRFIVSIDHGLDVVVLGTQFSVYSRPKGAKVVLQKGKVEVIRTNHPVNQRITMQPGDLVSVDPAGLMSTKRLPRPEVYTAWQNHRFEFDQTPLADIARLLEENYGMQVTITDTALARRTVSGTFSTRTATELSQVVADLLEVKMNQTGDRITFTDSSLNP